MNRTGWVFALLCIRLSLWGLDLDNGIVPENEILSGVRKTGTFETRSGE